MIFHESNGDLVFGLLQNLLRITMEKFFELMTSDLTSTSSRLGKSTPSKEEIRSPISYVDRSNSRIFYQRKTLQSNPSIELVGEELILCDMNKREEPLSPMHFINRGLKRCLFPEDAEDISASSSAHEETRSNFTLNKSLEDFKMCLMYEKSVHSSPKLLNSHFEDSGFLNCSMEMNSRLETISKTEIRLQKHENNSSVTFDSYLERDEKSQSKPDSNSTSNCQLITDNLVSGQNFDGHSTEFSELESSNA